MAKARDLGRELQARQAQPTLKFQKRTIPADLPSIGTTSKYFSMYGVGTRIQ
jgi:hypothetical protein